MPRFHEIAGRENGSPKKLWHLRAAKRLRQVALELKLPAGSWEVTSNKAGPAVGGEVLLLSEKVFVHLSCPTNGYGERDFCQYAYGEGARGGYYRTCEPSKLDRRTGRRRFDCGGGMQHQNHSLSNAEAESVPLLVSKLAALLR